MRGSRRPCIPGLNGAPRSSCKTRRSIQSPNGGGCDLVPMRRPSNASLTSKAHCD